MLPELRRVLQPEISTQVAMDADRVTRLVVDLAPHLLANALEASERSRGLRFHPQGQSACTRERGCSTRWLSTTVTDEGILRTGHLAHP